MKRERAANISAKKLQWSEHVENGTTLHCGVAWDEGFPRAEYDIWQTPNLKFHGHIKVGYGVVLIPKQIFKGVRRVKSAKAACQRHFDGFVRSLIRGVEE